MRRACVIGWPVEHSLSPLIHGHWLRRYGLDGSYTRQAVEPENFVQFIASLSDLGFVGANVTLPHKVAAFAHCKALDPAAVSIGAVNTLWLEGDTLHGANTDAYGFLANLDEKAPGWDGGRKRAAVIGAGGAARAILFALRQRGFDHIRIINRSLDRARELTADFSAGEAFPFEESAHALMDANLIVNTSSLGMTGMPPLSLDLGSVAPGATVCDIVYAPLHTELLVQANTRGLRAVDGLGMLLHQAVPGFEKWFGVRPEVTEVLRDEVLRAVRARETH